MKAKNFTPLLIISIAIILYGLYYIFSGAGGNLGPPFGIIIIVIGAAFLVPYFLLKRIFKTNIILRIITEVILIALLIFYYFKNDDRIMLHVPYNYRDYIFIVYGAERKPKLKSNHFFNSHIDVNLPASGIVFDPDSIEKNVVIIIDCLNGRSKTLIGGYGIPTAFDTLFCNHKRYVVDVYVSGDLPPDWNYHADSARRNLKKQLACEILNE